MRQFISFQNEALNFSFFVSIFRDDLFVENMELFVKCERALQWTKYTKNIQIIIG